jgi:hypothetical protein
MYGVLFDQPEVVAGAPAILEAASRGCRPNDLSVVAACRLHAGPIATSHLDWCQASEKKSDPYEIDKGLLGTGEPFVLFYSGREYC